jgi:peptide/nickel transport system substrate-binding protein
MQKPIRLRNDVFSKTHSIWQLRTVKAQDLNLARLSDEKLASPGGWVLSNVESFKAQNDSVFKLN